MELIRAATLTVSNIERSKKLYCEWLNYTEVEAGHISTSLAQSWGTPNTAGKPFCVLRPQSEAQVYVRMIEQPTVNEYKALNSYGWAAIEICNQDTLAVNEIMEKSPFEIIGVPQALDGLPSIFPMQVKGPDQEVVYLTEFKERKMESYDLPEAHSLIDRMFILVMACSDLDKSGAWLSKHLRIDQGPPMDLIYTLINDAFGLPEDDKQTIATLQHERDVFLEIDQLPAQAINRPKHEGMLPPCAALASFRHPDFDALDEINKDLWITSPAIYDGPIYNGKRAATMKAPDGTLIEVIDA
jgi:hypothetical protein